ncbi:MAG: hypothetical protein QNJ57_04380 [Flavobacteriaceae bacterium]|nr:hypothetical protein [Flavobacteriaceae bacterium]
MTIYAQTQEELERLQLSCADYWADLDHELTAIGLNKSFFDLRDVDKGISGIYNIEATERYPYDERISIRIYNHYYTAMAKEEYDHEKHNSRGVAGYLLIPDLGDDAFAIRRVEYGRLKSIIIEVVKGNVTVNFDIRGNTANDTNNRFTPASVFDFARAVVKPIPIND